MKKIFLVFAAVFCWAFQVFSASLDYSSTTNLHARDRTGRCRDCAGIFPTLSRGKTGGTELLLQRYPRINLIILIRRFTIRRAVISVTGKNSFSMDYGAPLEDVYVHYAPALKDLVTLYEYDSNGRPNVTWLPISTTGDDEHFVEPTDVKSRAKTYYKDTAPYREVVYKNDPLDQVVRQFNAGAVFKTHNKFVQTERKCEYGGRGPANCHR